jgi:hypothetical protein
MSCQPLLNLNLVDYLGSPLACLPLPLFLATNVSVWL